MNLASTLWIYAGGPGSGCSGPNCGRPQIVGKQLAGPSGSNAGGLYKGSDGVSRYVKFYKDAAQARGEVLANKIYRDLKLGAPKSEVFDHNGKTAFASELIDGGKKLSEVHITKDVANKVLDGLAADVLTANWDAVGLEHDNVIVKDGQVYRIDQGGTFLKRAQGGDKPASVLNAVPELEGFLNWQVNPAYAGVAKVAGVTTVAHLSDRLEKQVSAIVSLRDKNGGWKSYVEKASPEMPSDEKQKIVGMLESRTKLLDKRFHN